MKEGSLQHSELWQDLQDLEAGLLPDEDRDALMKTLADSADARQLYLEYFELSALLAEEAGTEAEQRDLLPQLRPRVRWRTRAMALAAAACVLLGLSLHFWPDHAPPPGSHAHLKASAGPATEWRVDSQAQHPRVLAGSTVRVEAGTLKLRHPGGSLLILQGPAQVQFASLNQVRIEEGWLWLDTAESGESFELETPDLLLRNIGTRFGVHVPVDNPAEVHLLEGRVDAYARRSKEKLVQLLPENQGVILQPKREPAGIPLAPNPFPTAQGLIADGPPYEAVVLSQAPLDYWRLDSEPDGSLPNRISGFSYGNKHPDVIMSAGPDAATGLPGFDSGNRALQLEGITSWAPVSLGTSPLHSDLIFREDFNYPGALHGLRPDQGASTAQWIASTAFGGDGRLDPHSTGTATLAFTPLHGRIYTLDASFKHIQSEPDVDSWVGLGFASGQSISSYIYGIRENRFLEGQTTGRAWMLFRATGSPLEHQAFLGSSGKNGGIADASNWIEWNDGPGGDIDLRVILDTTGGEGKWLADWQAKRPDEKDYRSIRPPHGLLHEEIRSVGLVVGKKGLSGRVTHVSLRADAMEPQPARDWLATLPSKLNRRSGSISLWLRASEAPGEEQIVWSAGSSPREDAMHLRLTPSGQPAFFIDNDRYDVLLTAKHPLTDGEWHHIVVCWARDRAELHIDGKLAMANRAVMPMSPKELREFHLGSGALNSGLAPLRASVDEIAVWQRALTAREIRLQYQAARGQLPLR